MVESTGLENRRCESIRGFESHSLRQLYHRPAEVPKWPKGHENKFYDEYHATTKKLGIRDLPPYSCRHTTATEAVKKGVELPVVQQIMRHSKLASTQRYIHVSTEAAHRGVNQLEK